tara:strand:- start:1876 stop:5535 length:3660 start_codon:yes stop_codon:yes gene_type:complete
MRIAIDLQGIQSEGSRTRGIGRYSFEIVRNLVREYPQNTFILVANASLLDLRQELESELKLSNVIYYEWYSPCPLSSISKNKTNLQLGSSLRSYAFSLLHADIILITSFIEGFSDNCLTDFDKELLKTPIVSIFYDVIPLLNSHNYLRNNPKFSKFYKRKLKSMADLDALLAISESSANEAAQYLGIKSNKVYNISSACNTLDFNDKQNHIPNVNLEKYKPYILYSGAGDPRKNLRRLLQSFSQLPNTLRRYNLVLVGKLLIPEITLIDEWINEFKVDPFRVFKTGYISDENLADLYKNCSLFVFPSLHEGFGLPILEAMNCGAPVIGSRSTSVPEIINMNEAMFDPNNTIEITNLIIKSLTDNNFRTKLIQNSITQRKKFSWSYCVRATNEVFLNVLKEHFIDYDSSNWIIIKDKNNFYLKALLKKIKNYLLFRFKLNKKLIYTISASIDHINCQADSIARFISNDTNILSWKVEGPFDSSYSLAILNRYLTQEFNYKIPQLLIHNTEGLGDYSTNINYLKKFPSLYSIYEKSLSESSLFTQVISRNLYPPRVSDLNAKINLLHSYGWEESEFPSDWVKEFNTYLQGMTVMSSQVKKILLDNGVYIPIHISGLGVDHINRINAAQDFHILGRRFKLLHISSGFPRKGLDVLLSAFGKAFSIKDDVSLIIKTFNNPHNEIDQLIQSARENNPLYPDVVLYKDDFSDSEIKALYLQSDLLVAPSRGEGFGLPIGEAMQLGIPVITTGWGGQLDFCNNTNSWLIDYKFAASESHFSLTNSYWAEPHDLHLSTLMKEIYVANESQIRIKTDQAKKTILKYNWKNVASKNIRLARYLNSYHTNHSCKIGWVSTWFTRCGIASYSKYIIKQIEEEVFVFSPFEDEKPGQNSKNIIPSWKLDNSESQDFDMLLNEIVRQKITTLVVQFNYGFFNFNDFNQFLLSVKNYNINIIIFLHSTSDPITNTNKKLCQLLSSLKTCDRILVHNIDDLNRLKEIGLIDNVSIFPHGILDFESKPSDMLLANKKFSKNSIFEISSYGFCLPNKGYSELVKAVKILREREYQIKLNIFSSIYSDDYYWVYEELLSLVRDLGLQDYISINNNYLSDNEILMSLSHSDLILIPYQSSMESSSASVRHAIATFKPVLVTPLPLFDDVKDIVEFTKGFSPEDLAESIINFLSNTQENINSVWNDSTRIKKIKDRSYSNVAYRLYCIIKGLENNKNFNL